jgi:hypothetical protein
MAGNSYTNVFGGGVISPAIDSWNSYTIAPTIAANFTGTISGTTLTVTGVTGVIAANQTLVGAGIPANTTIVSGAGTTWTISASIGIGPIPMSSGPVNLIQLVWPQETAPSGNLSAQIIEFASASTSSGGIILPPANQVSVGQFLIVNNLSAYTQSVYSYGGAIVVSGLLPGAVYFIYLQNNSTQAGTWLGFQYGSATSAPNASALQGSGLLAIGTTLNQDIVVTTYTSTPQTINTSQRAIMINWGSGSGTGTFNLPSSSSAAASWYCQIRNSSTSTLTIVPNGSDNINGNTTLVMQPGDSCFMVTDGTGNWFTLGLGTTQPVFFNFTTLPVTGGIVQISGANLNKISYKLTGTLTSNLIIDLPNYAQTYWFNTAALTFGTYTVTVQVPTVPGGGTPIGSTVGLPANQAQILYADNAGNVINAVSSASFSGYPITVAQGGTGGTTQATAQTGIGGGAAGINVFTATTNSGAQAALAILSAADATALSLVL